MGSPRFKIFNSAGEYKASCKDAEDAAALVSIYGDNAKIKDGSTSGPVVWREGFEEAGPAGESYDTVAEVIWERINERNRKAMARYYEQGRL